MQIVHREANTSPPRILSPSLSASPNWQITFQDWLGHTFGPIRAWHTHRKKIRSGFITVHLAYSQWGFKCLYSLSLHSGHTGPQGHPASGDLFSCRLPSCQLWLLLEPCEPLTLLRLILWHRWLCLRFYLLFCSLHRPALPRRQSPALICPMEVWEWWE